MDNMDNMDSFEDVEKKFTDQQLKLINQEIAFEVLVSAVKNSRINAGSVDNEVLNARFKFMETKIAALDADAETDTADMRKAYKELQDKIKEQNEVHRKYEELISKAIEAEDQLKIARQDVNMARVVYEIRKTRRDYTSHRYTSAELARNNGRPYMWLRKLG